MQDLAGVVRWDPKLPPDERPGGDIPQALQAHARALGCLALGVTSAEPLPAAREAWQAWLAAGHHGGMAYLEQPDRADPRSLLPQAKSAIVVAIGYPPSRELVALRRPSEPRPRGRIAGYAQAVDYHSLLWRKLGDLGQHLTDLLGQSVVGRPCVDTAPLLERALAARAGVGFQGKSTLTLIPGVGTTVFLGTLLTDADLPPSIPLQPRCGECTACLDICPTGAFVGPYVLDARRCIAYLTIEHRGVIPRELRRGIGTRVFGCDACQEVCPFNGDKPRPWAPELSHPAGLSVDLIELLELRSSGYRRLVKGRALRRVSRPMLQRNAAVALGNSGAAAAVDPLVRCLRENPNALVRLHAAWALGELGGDAARRALEGAHDSDEAAEVREEAGLALVSSAPIDPSAQRV